MSDTSKIKTCVFPVAGLGSRFLPATKSIPKEMLVVVDKPLIQYAVEEAKAAGIERFIFVTSQGKSAIEDHFDTAPNLESLLRSRGKVNELAKLEELRLQPGQAVYVRQHSPLGLGHAVLCASSLVDEDAFAVILADDLILGDKPCLKQMIDSYNVSDGNMIAVMNVDPSKTDRYGILDVANADGEKLTAKDIVEKPPIGTAPSNVAAIGRYILRSDIFGFLKNQSAGAGGEIQLTDSIQKMIKDFGLSGFNFKGHRFDCGNKEGWLEANLAFACQDQDLRASLQSKMNKHLNNI